MERGSREDWIQFSVESWRGNVKLQYSAKSNYSYQNAFRSQGWMLQFILKVCLSLRYYYCKSWESNFLNFNVIGRKNNFSALLTTGLAFSPRMTTTLKPCSHSAVAGGEESIAAPKQLNTCSVPFFKMIKLNSTNARFLLKNPQLCLVILSLLYDSAFNCCLLEVHTADGKKEQCFSYHCLGTTLLLTLHSFPSFPYLAICKF